MHHEHVLETPHDDRIKPLVLVKAGSKSLLRLDDIQLGVAWKTACGRIQSSRSVVQFARYPIDWRTATWASVDRMILLDTNRCEGKSAVIFPYVLAEVSVNISIPR